MVTAVLAANTSADAPSKPDVRAIGLTPRVLVVALPPDAGLVAPERRTV